MHYQDTLNVAAAQINSDLGEVDANLDRHLEVIADAHERPPAEPGTAVDDQGFQRHRSETSPDTPGVGMATPHVGIAGEKGAHEDSWPPCSGMVIRERIREFHYYRPTYGCLTNKEAAAALGEA